MFAYISYKRTLSECYRSNLKASLMKRSINTFFNCADLVILSGMCGGWRWVSRQCLQLLPIFNLSHRRNKLQTNRWYFTSRWSTQTPKALVSNEKNWRPFLWFQTECGLIQLLFTRFKQTRPQGQACMHLVWAPCVKNTFLFILRDQFSHSIIKLRLFEAEP